MMDECDDSGSFHLKEILILHSSFYNRSNYSGSIMNEEVYQD